MRRIMFLVSVTVLSVAIRAEAGILNEVDFTDIKGFVNGLEVSNAWFYDLEGERNLNVVSASLFTYENKDLGLGSLRIGYAERWGDFDPAIALGYVEAAIPNIVNRFIPAQFHGLKANLAALTLIPSVGYGIGFDWDTDELVHGPVVGAKLRF